MACQRLLAAQYLGESDIKHDSRLIFRLHALRFAGSDFRSFMGASASFPALTFNRPSQQQSGRAEHAPTSAAADLLSSRLAHTSRSILLIEDLPRAHCAGDFAFRSELVSCFRTLLEGSVSDPVILVVSEGEEYVLWLVAWCLSASLY